MILYFPTYSKFTLSASMNVSEVKEGEEQGMKTVQRRDGETETISGLLSLSHIQRAAGWEEDCSLRVSVYTLPLFISSVGSTATLYSSSIIKRDTMLKFRVGRCSRCAAE